VGKKKYSRRHGFSLLEILLSVALISMIAGLSVPIYNSFQTRNNLDIATETFVQTARRAISLAQASEGDSTWGVYAETGSIVLFKGSSFASRSNGFDESFYVTDVITPSGDTEFVFSKLTGFPNISGSIIFTSINNDTKTVTINSKGTISY